MLSFTRAVNTVKSDPYITIYFTAHQVSHLLAALQQGSRGTQACINAASAVQGIVGDLDTTVMFAATGTLQPETEGDTFGDHRFVYIKHYDLYDPNGKLGRANGR